MLASLNQVTRYFGDRLILKEISATIEDNDRIGLIGPNGAGKSTLLHLLSKKLVPDEGEVGLGSGLTIGLLEQNSGLDGLNTIYQEMRSVFAQLLETEETLRHLEKQISASTHHGSEYQALCETYSKLSSWFESQEGYHIDVKIKTVLNGMGFEDKAYDLKISSLSGGEKTRLALAKLLLEEPKLLILDEPTNHLDFKTLMWLEDYLQSYRGGLLIVSHDRYFLDKMVTKIWEIENHQLIAYPGNYSKYKLLRSERIKRLQKEYEAQQNKINSMLDYAQKNIVRATTANMAKSRLHQLEHIEVMEKPIDFIPSPHFQFDSEKRPVKDVLTVRNLSLSVGEGKGKVTLCQNLNFEVKRGEKIALIGPNGIGKSTLLKTILGDLPADGKVSWGGNVQTSYYEQENMTLNKENTALEELWGRFPLMAEYKVRGILGQVLITGENAFKQIGVLSGGERARVALAVIMAEHANTLILDEPTNHLDLNSKEELEKALIDFEGTLIFVSHDRYFLNTIPTKILELSPNGIESYEGNFDYYLEHQKPPDVSVAEPKTPSRQEQGYYRSKQERAEQAKRRTRLTRLEELIEETELQIAALEQEMGKPEVTSDYEKLNLICKELEGKRTEHEQYFSEWAELSDSD